MSSGLLAGHLHSGRQLSATFPPHLEEVRSARQFVTAACAEFGLTQEVCEVAVLLTSELVTNAFTHGRSAARVVLHSDGRCLHVEVADDNSRYPHVQALDPEALDGRGLQILDVAASHWGVRPDEFGKVVWFGVACPAEPPTGA